MKTTLRLVLPAAALLLAGCPTAGMHTPDLPVRLTATPGDSIAPGDSLRMTAYLRNPTRQPVRLEFDSQCQVEFYVMGPDNSVLHPPGSGTTCVRAPSVLTLQPGDSVRFADSWMATSATTGPHSAYAVLWEHHVARDGERAYEAGHRSNIIQFKVTASPE
jgi:Intracellular proteinase inhibitor